MGLKETYDRIAKDWHKDHHDDDWWHKGTDEFISFLKPGDCILEAGCGAGHKTKYLTSKGFEVTGVDFSKNLLEIAKQEAPDATYVLSDMTEMDGVGGDYDAVFSQASLLHIPKKDVVRVLNHWKDKLKVGGFLYIAVKGIREGQPEEHVLKENDYGYEYERFFSYYSLGELKKYFEEVGLKLVYENENLVGKTNWIQIVGRK